MKQESEMSREEFEEENDASLGAGLGVSKGGGIGASEKRSGAMLSLLERKTTVYFF